MKYLAIHDGMKGDLVTIIERKEMYGVSREKKFLIYPIILPSVTTRVSSQQCSVLSTTLKCMDEIYGWFAP